MYQITIRTSPTDSETYTAIGDPLALQNDAYDNKGALGVSIVRLQ